MDKWNVILARRKITSQEYTAWKTNDGLYEAGKDTHIMFAIKRGGCGCAEQSLDTTSRTLGGFLPSATGFGSLPTSWVCNKCGRSWSCSQSLDPVSVCEALSRTMEILIYKLRVDPWGFEPLFALSESKRGDFTSTYLITDPMRILKYHFPTGEFFRVGT
jgi:hypothetical protein